LKYWEIIADNLHKAGFSMGWVSALNVEGQTIWIVEAHGYGKRFIVRQQSRSFASPLRDRIIHDSGESNGHVTFKQLHFACKASV
jgi:hypothetical protein